MRVLPDTGTKLEFINWLLTGNAKNYSLSETVSNIDKMSELAIRKNTCHTDFWCITQPSDFEHIYTKILDEKQLRILDRNTYKTFIVVGQLYLKFLREKLFSNDGTDADREGMHTPVTPWSGLPEKKEVIQSEKQLEKQALRDIDPENLIAWLITQPNANGTLYLERVVRTYIWVLRNAPAKLVLATVGNRNVFSCQTVKELKSLWDVFKSAPNYKDVNKRAHGQFSAGLRCLSRYLEYLSEREENTPLDGKDSTLFPNTVQAIQDKPLKHTAIPVDFDRPGRCAQTQPVSCTINGQAVIPNKMNWSHLLVAITERFIIEGYPHLANLDKTPLYGSRAFFLPRKTDIGRCALLSNGKWISTNYPPQIIVALIRNLCRHCGVRLEGVSISYMPKNESVDWLAKRPIRGKASTQDLFTENLAFKPEVVNAVSDILTTHFPNGFRADSPIELMRFRNIAADDSTESIPLTDEELKKAISLCGTLFEGKVYVVGKETESRLKEEIDAELFNGTEIIYYANFYARHESWLFAGRVISENMLKDMLKMLFPAYTYKASYFSTKRNNGTELSIIKSEIIRVWNGDVLLNYEQISARLPYIPLGKIKYALAMNGDFIWNSTEAYTHIGMVDISDEERVAIDDYVANACHTAGFASMSDVLVNAIEDHNNELSLTAIYNAVFAIVLSGKYEKRGKIITRKGDSLDALILMKERCHSIDKCTLKELLHYAQDLTGDAYPWIALEAGYEVLVRTDEDAFVAEKYVQFDVDGIDATLDLFVTGQYLPLKSVTTFATFPHCRQAWNLFLLESYCRKFSRRYRFESLTMNSRNAGAIVRKSCILTYADILADAVAVDDVELIKTYVLEFLYKSGYIGRRSYAYTEELMKQSKILREKSN